MYALSSIDKRSSPDSEIKLVETKKKGVYYYESSTFKTANETLK